MAKLSAIEKNRRRRRKVAAEAKRRAALKAIVMDKSRPMDERFNASMKLAALPRDGSKTRIRNRCELSGRPRGFYRKTRMSRIAMRQLAGEGQIPGMVKSSW